MLEQISEHVWIMPKDDQTDRPALGYVFGGKTSLMVDSGNSPDHISYFYGNVRSMGMPDPSYVVLTHWHWDHIFGLSGSPAKSIAHILTNERLQVMQRWDWSDGSLNARVAAGVEIQFSADMIRKEMPIRHSFKVKQADISFEVQCNIRLEELDCHLIHIGGPHSDDSIVVYLPQDKVVFLGDCYNPDLYNNDSLRLSELTPLIKRIEEFEADWFIPSHDEPVKKADFIRQLRTIEKVGLMVGDLKNPAQIQKKLETALKQKPDEEMVDIARNFVAGNVSSGRNPIDRQFFIR